MPRTLRQAFDAGNPNSLGNAAQELPMGRALSVLPVFARLTFSGQVGLLPDNAKAAQILRCYGVAGSVGNKTVAAPEGAPGAGAVAVNQTGDIAAGDAGLTAAEVYYLPYEGEVVEEELPVAGSVATIPGGHLAGLLISATVTTGLIPGAKIVDDRATAPATMHAALNALGTGIAFNASDVVAGFATVKYLRRPLVTIADSLEQTVQF